MLLFSRSLSLALLVLTFPGLFLCAVPGSRPEQDPAEDSAHESGPRRREGQKPEGDKQGELCGSRAANFGVPRDGQPSSFFLVSPSVCSRACVFLST